jgi:hypothetical protein
MIDRMADTHAISILTRKRDEIENLIASYLQKIEAAKRELLAVNQVLRLFEIDGEPQQWPVSVDISRIWRRGEIVTAAWLLLEAEGPLDTREIARRLVKMKGMDETDAVPCQSVGYRIVQALSVAAKRGTIADAGRRKNVRLWGSRI